MADNSLLEKVLGLQEKYEALQAQLADPEVISDMKKFVQLNKEYKELTPIIEAGNEFKRILENYEMAKEILATEKDEDLREMAKEEIAEIEPVLPEWEEKIKLLLIPADPQDSDFRRRPFPHVLEVRRVTRLEDGDHQPGGRCSRRIQGNCLQGVR